MTRWSSRLQENYPSFYMNLRNIRKMKKGNPESSQHVASWTVGLGNTWILSDYAQKSPRALALFVV